MLSPNDGLSSHPLLQMRKIQLRSLGHTVASIPLSSHITWNRSFPPHPSLNYIIFD